MNDLLDYYKKKQQKRHLWGVTLWKLFVEGSISQFFLPQLSFTKHNGVEYNNASLEWVFPHSRDKMVFSYQWAINIFCMFPPISGCGIFICLILKAP